MNPTILYYAVTAMLILLCIVIYLWLNKLREKDKVIVSLPAQGYLRFPMNGKIFKTPLDGDKLPSGIFNEFLRLICSGKFNGFEPNKLLEVDWVIYFMKFAKGHGKNDSHDDHDKSHDKDEHKDDRKKNGGNSEEADSKMIRITDVPKKFDAVLLCDGIDTKDTIGLMYMLNMSINITNGVKFISRMPYGIGGTSKLLSMVEGLVEAFNRQKTYEDIVELFAKNEGKQEFIDFILEHNDEIEKEVGARIESLSIPVWNLDDGSEASQAIKQKAINEAKGKARITELEAEIAAAQKLLEKAGIDYKRIQKENEGKDDLRQKFGDEVYMQYVKYTEGIAKLQTYVEGGSNSVVAIPPSNTGGAQGSTGNQGASNAQTVNNNSNQPTTQNKTGKVGTKSNP